MLMRFFSLYIEAKCSYTFHCTTMYSELRYNIPKLYILQALRWFMLIIPVLVLFYRENGLSMQEVFLLQTGFSIVIVAAEIPSGYFSDVMGRRNTLIIGTILGASGVSYYCFADCFAEFLIAESILGIGASFISGTDSALLYDTLHQAGDQNLYISKEGRMMSIGNFSEGTASVIGGLLAIISLRTPLYAEAILMILAVPIAFSLVEPTRQKYDTSKGKLRGIIDIVRFAVYGHAEVKWLLLYSSVVGASTLTMVWFIQPYLKEAGLPLPVFGVLWAVLQYAVGVFSLWAHRVEHRVGRKRVFLSLVFLSVVGYALLGVAVSLWLAPAFLFFYFVRGVSGPVFNGYINALISSDMRATVLSVKAMGVRLIFSVVGPFVGWISDIYSLNAALYMSAAIFFVLGAISLVFVSIYGLLEAKEQPLASGQ